MKALRIVLVTLCIQIICGCARYYTPSASRPFEAITEFVSTSSVTIQNGQPSKEQVAFHDYQYANYNAWTDVAINIAERELKKRGLRIVNDAQKILTMSVISAHTEAGFVKVSSSIVMNAKTSDGYSATFTGENSSVMAANLDRQIDGALMRVVVEMLKDQHIVAFLTK